MCQPDLRNGGEDSPMSDIAACQFEPVVGDVATNIETIETFCEELETNDIAIFPELCLSGYDCRAATDVADTIPGTVTDPLVTIADRTDCSLVVGLPERVGDSYYNSVAFVNGEGVQQVYRKQRLWGDESDPFDAGTEPVVAETAVGRVGFLVGYDLNFPELAIKYADLGCDVLVTVAAWQTTYGGDWDLLLRTRGLDTQAYMVGCNHVGQQADRVHAGHSLVSDPRGHLVAEADDERASVTAMIDSERLRTARNHNPVRRTRNRIRRLNLQPEICPECDNDLKRQSGTLICQSCNWHRRHPAD